LSYAADKQINRQTNRQTALNVLPTLTDRVGVGYDQCTMLQRHEWALGNWIDLHSEFVENVVDCY